MSHGSRRFPPDTLSILPSAARTTDTTSETFDATPHSVPRIYDGVVLVVEVTAETLLSEVVVNLQVDDGTGTFTTLLASAAVTALGTTVLIAHPDVPDASNLTAQAAVTGPWRVFVDHLNADSITYSVSAAYIP